jgi:hypothetical protein
VDSGVIHPRAIAFLAGKISSLSGDIRKALDVCRSVILRATIYLSFCVPYYANTVILMLLTKFTAMRMGIIKTERL